MKPEVLKYLEDVRLSIEAIQRYTSDLKNAEEYSHDAETIDAVERRLAIVGEALYQARKIDDSLPITDVIKIIALRHILVHEYDLVTNSTIWAIVQNKLPLLKSEVEAVLKSFE